jgi:sugar phosphate isomerase/epimerase
LILSSQTLRWIPIPVRAAAAAGAGFISIGAHHEDLERAPIDGVRDAVEAAGVNVAEVGFLHRWAGPEHAAREEREALFDMARSLGAGRVNAGLFAGPDRARIVDRYRTLCKAAADVGLRISLEFFPFGALANAVSAWEVIEGAGQPNSDVLFDAWHWHRGGADIAMLSAVPPGAIRFLQLSDAAPVVSPDVGEESRHGRLLPGSGAIDLTGLLRGLTAAGHHPTIAVEVLSDELTAMDPRRAASLAASSTRQVLKSASWLD